FFFNDTATTEIYPLSLHDALPILSTFDPLLCFLLNFLLNFYRISITSHCAPRIVASHIETVYWKGLPRPRTFYIDLSVVFVLIIFQSYRHCGHINGEWRCYRKWSPALPRWPPDRWYIV